MVAKGRVCQCTGAIKGDSLQFILLRSMYVAMDDDEVGMTWVQHSGDMSLWKGWKMSCPTEITAEMYYTQRIIFHEGDHYDDEEMPTLHKKSWLRERGKKERIFNKKKYISFFVIVWPACWATRRRVGKIRQNCLQLTPFQSKVCIQN